MKSCVITGGYNGLGLSLARKLAKAGYGVVISGRDEAKLARALEQLKGAGANATAIKVDVTKVRECKKLVDHCINTYGSLDLMVNNAGVLEDGVKPKLVDRIVDTNLKGVEYCSYYALERMKKQKEGGMLVNISSTSGVNIKANAAGEAIYASSKFGVTAYSGYLFKEHRDSKIRVLCFCPGGTKTDLFRNDPSRLLPDFMDPDAAAGVLARQIIEGQTGLMVLERKGLLKHDREFSPSWNWATEQTINFSEFK
jgi:NAD(P)-dependent dehydrogenase (short-subunit alcohol dehydrogenase family)